MGANVGANVRRRMWGRKMNQTPTLSPGLGGPIVRPKRRPVVAKVRRINACCYIAVAPDANIEGWRRRLQELFASSSRLFVEASLKQIVAASKLPGEATASTASVSAALEIIASLQPENEAQAALAIHIACLHCASLNVLSRIHCIGERNMIAIATAASKLERAFHNAIETYNRMKRGVTQIVRVERVEVQAGAQAVIGVVGPQSR
jgi:hypothetical protein